MLWPRRSFVGISFDFAGMHPAHVTEITVGTAVLSLHVSGTHGAADFSPATAAGSPLSATADQVSRSLVSHLVSNEQ
jgi:hypothetical protein